MPSRPDAGLTAPVSLTRRLFQLCTLALLLGPLGALPARAQEATPADSAAAAQPDSLQVGPGRADTSLASPAPPQLATGQPRSSEGEQLVQFSARDSLVITFDDQQGDTGTLYGNVDVQYGEASLAAYRVDLRFQRDELHAAGLPSDTGMVGRPFFQRGSEAFYGDELAYNMQTERGRVVGARTSFSEGFVRGNVVKVMEDSTLYIARGAYSTCECETDPSYSLRSDRMKVKDEWVYTGPIRLYIFNIPMPFWLPFGFLPATEGRRTGPLPPQYGEDERGFYLRDWGWYWAISDYMDLQVQFGVWSRGSWQVNPFFRYTRRYNYSGQVRLNYSINRRGEANDPNFLKYRAVSLQWRHNQEVNPFTSLNADVDLTSTNYLRTVSDRYEDRVKQTIGSSVKFNKRWTGTGRNLALSLSQRQVLATGAADLTIPNLNFSQSSRKPFAREQRPPGQGERWYEKITYSYSGSVNNRFSFNPIDDEALLARGDTAAADASWYEALFSPSLYRRATGDDVPFDFEAQHRVPVSVSFSVERLPLLHWQFPVTLTPNVNYNENWYLYTQRRSLAPDSTVATREVPGFFALRRFNLGVSSSTTFYGLFPVRIGTFQGLRHTVRPSASFSYQPDFFGDIWGYTRSYTNARGETVDYPIVRGVPQGLQQSLSLSVNNVFETRRVTVDSTGAENTQRLKLLNVDFSTNYNFAADSFKLGNLSLSARTRLFDKVNITYRSTFSPYALQEREGQRRAREINRYVWADGFGLPRLTQLNLSLSTSFQSANRQGARRPVNTPRAQPSAFPLVPAGEAPLDEDEPFSSPYYNTAVGYADFSIPWALNVDFTYSLRRPLDQLTRTFTLNTSFDFNLTPNWKIQGRSGYDFERKELVTTTLSIFRDLGCWEMSFRWTPFGRYQSYGFDLHVKSSLLSDLLRIRQPRSDVRGRFEGLLN